MWTPTPREKSKTGFQGIAVLNSWTLPLLATGLRLLSVFAVVTCPLLPFFCSKRCCCRRLVVGRQCCRMGV
ncbi:hypothetical protein DPMN_158501 [Dreissena polymorpha]|uniref:Uncharacterized protein n=1 Tax=Dreissena polymorpha TaxID=45954 RepID=A0A9D4IPV3_DREPO|nr:hypothetical protein DPMN_064134 [Dreissena polymorpha]KAH3780682.1 hypothetical protein DPMN_158501 [Dreissena polymorpha]